MVLLLLAPGRGVLAVPISGTVSSDWPMFAHDERHTNNNPGMPSDFKPPLFPRWIVTPRDPSTQFRAQQVSFPSVKDGKLFVSTNQGNQIFRLDAATGAQEAEVRHPPQDTWPGISGIGGPLLFNSGTTGMVAWGLGGDGFTRGRGISAIPASFPEAIDATADALFSPGTGFSMAGPADIFQVPFGRLIAFDGVIVASDHTGRPFALDTNGHVLWENPTAGPNVIDFSGAILGCNAPAGYCLFSANVFMRELTGVGGYDLYTGVRRMFCSVGGKNSIPSLADNVLIIPNATPRELLAIDVFNGAVLWADAEDGANAADTVAIGDGKVVWNTFNLATAFDVRTGTPIWSTTITTGSADLVIGNGYVWTCGNRKIGAIRMQDGFLEWEHDLPTGFGTASVLTPLGGGELIQTGGRAVLALGTHPLPLPLQGLPVVTPGDADLLLAWVPPPLPPPDVPQLAAYIIVRQCLQGTAPIGTAAQQFAYFDLATKMVDLPLPAPGGPPPPVAGKVVISLPNHLSTPPMMDVTTVPITDPTQFDDNNLNSGTSCSYQILVVDAQGNVSAPSPPTSPTKVLHHVNGTPGAVLTGGDWLEAEHDIAHTGWNPDEHLGYTPNSGLLFSNVQDGFQRAWTFAGLSPGTTFTQPVASLGRVYVGGSDGRLYALNAQTGDLLWWVSTGAPIRYPPAIRQSRQQINSIFATTLEPVQMEGIMVSSDSGNIYSIAIGPADPAPLSIERTVLGGTPVCAPNSYGLQLFRGPGDVFSTNFGPLPVHEVSTDGFIGPNNSIILNHTGFLGAIMTEPFGLFPLHIPGPLGVKSVRPSRSIYHSGIEELVAGFSDGWFALASDPTTPEWVPLKESPVSSPSTGGIVDPWGQDPSWYFDVPVPNYSDSVVDAVSVSGPFSISHYSFDGIQSIFPGCDFAGAALLDGATGLTGDSMLIKDPVTGGVAQAAPQGGTQFSMTLQQLQSSRTPTSTGSLNTTTMLATVGACSDQSTGSNTASSPCVTSVSGVADSITSEGLIPFCSFGNSAAPTKLVTGSTDSLGRFSLNSEYPFTDFIYSRAFRFAGGSSVVGEAWTGVFALRASGQFDVLNGQLQRVTLVWAPTPWPAAVGYKVYREELSVTPGGTELVPNPYHEIADVPGRGSRLYTDDQSGTQARLLRYMVRAYRAPLPGDLLNAALGAPSLTVRPEPAIIDAEQTITAPDLGFEEDTFLVTVQVTISKNLVGTQALVGTSTTDTSQLTGDIVISRVVDPNVPAGTQPLASQVSTGIRQPVPGVPVRLAVADTGDGSQHGLVRTSLTDPGVENFDQTLVTDSEGKIQVLFQPYIGSTANGGYEMQFFGEIGDMFTLDGRILNFVAPDFFVTGHNAPEVASWSGWLYAPSWEMSVPALIAQGFGTLTGPNMFGGVTPIGGSATESAIQDAVVQADFYGSPLLPCQGLACSVPVNTMSGMMMMEVPDLVLRSRGASLGWGRTYTNFRVGFTPNGRGWHSGFDQRLERLPGGSYRLFTWSGDVRLYRLVAGQFISPPGTFDTLVQLNNGGVRLTDRPGNVLEFDASLNLIRMADRHGFSQRLTYSAGHLASITDDVGQSITLAYDGKGRVRQVQDSADRVVKYEYNNLDQLTKVARPGGEVATYTYGADGLLASWSEPKLPMGAKQGAVIYDVRHRVSQVFDGEGQRKHTLGYASLPDGTSRTTISETCCGPRVDVYDKRGILTQQIDATGHSTLMTFDDQIRLTSRTDRNGHTTQITYNAMGLPATITDALGNQTKYEYEPAHGFLTAVTDALNRRTTFQYDASGDCVGTTDAAGGTWAQAFDGYGQLRSRTDALGHAQTFDYNSVGDLIAVSDALNRATQFDFDARHREVTRTDAKGRSIDFSYDDRDLRTVVAYPDGATTRTEHDAYRRTTLVTDALNHATRSAYDKDDRLVRMTDPRGAVTQYRYDVQGNLLGVTDANTHETVYTYNSLNRLTKIADPLGKTQQYSYDPEGNRVERIDGNHMHTMFTFDALNRLVLRNLPDGKTEVFAFDSAGQMTKSANAAADIRYTHDSLGRVTEHRYANLNKSFQHAWDSVGNRTMLTYPDGNTMRYTFDAANEQVSASDTQAGTFALAYDETGMKTMLAYPNGLTTRYTYDQRDRVLSILTYGSKSVAPEAAPPNFLYTYDLSGNRLTQDRSDEGLTSYRYDPKDKLIKADFPKRAYQQFTYDLVGNRLKLEEVEHDSKVHITDYEYDEGDELLKLTQDFRDSPASAPGLVDCPDNITSELLAGPGAPPTQYVTTFTYDGNGARVTKAPDTGAETAYAWDTQERLSQVAEGSRILESNAYDPFARRSSLTADGTPTLILADATRLINASLVEFTPGTKNASPVRRLWVSHRLMGSIIANRSELLLVDALGSVAATAGSNASVTSRSFYQPFGETRAQGAEAGAASAIGFVGSLGVRQDASSLLGYMWRRFYNARQGDFLSRDPLETILAAKYMYGRNSPMRYIDPLGLDVCDTLARIVTCYTSRPATCEASFGSPCRASCAGVNDPEDSEAMNKCLRSCSKNLQKCMKSYRDCVGI